MAFNDSKTKQLIMELSDFRDQIGLHSDNDSSDELLVTDGRGSDYRISEAEIKAIKQVIDKNSKLKEKASGIYIACHVLLGYFHFSH